MINSVINSLILLVIGIYFITVWKEHPFSVGGSLIYSSIICMNLLVSALYKEISSILTGFSFMIFLLILLNLFAYFEFISPLPYYAYGIFVISYVVFVFTISILIIKPFLVKPDNLPPSSQAEIITRPIGYVFSRAIPLIFYSCLPAFIFAAARNDIAIKSDDIKSLSVLSLIITSILLLWMFIDKEDVFDRAVSKIITLRSELNPKKVKKAYLSAILLCFLLGSVFESMRGFWLTWTASCVVLLLVSMNLWRTWKYVFLVKKKTNYSEIDNEALMKLPTTRDSQYLVKYSVVILILGLIYIFALTFMLIAESETVYK